MSDEFTFYGNMCGELLNKILLMSKESISHISNKELVGIYYKNEYKERDWNKKISLLCHSEFKKRNFNIGLSSEKEFINKDMELFKEHYKSYVESKNNLD